MLPCFLAIIVPAILLLFIVYGLFSRWVFSHTGLPVGNLERGVTVVDTATPDCLPCLPFAP